MATTNHAKSVNQDVQEPLTMALFQLLETKNLHDITVTTLITSAGVSRSVFDQHFTSVKDVLIAYYEPQIVAVFDDILVQVTPDEKLSRLTTFFDQFAEPLLLATKRDFEPLIQESFNRNMARYYSANLAWQELPEVTIVYWTKFMAGGIYAIWRTWLLTGRKESLATLHALIESFQRSTMQAVMLDFILK
jgi:AcrR family transcriptional regulator